MEHVDCEPLGPDARHPSDDDLFDLAHGLVSQEERESLGEHLTLCATCERRVRLFARDRIHSELRAMPATPVRPRRWRWAAATAIAATVLVALFVTVGTGPQQQESYLLPEPEWLNKRSVVPEENASRMALGVEAYRAQRFEEAVAHLEAFTIPAGLKKGGLRNVFLADALAKTGRPDEAKAYLLSDEVEVYPREWRDRAHWILIPLIAEEDAETSRQLLELLAEPGGEFTARASAALEPSP